MGLCVDADENSAGMEFEVRSRSVIFHCSKGLDGRGDMSAELKDGNGGMAKSIEVDKEFLLRLFKLMLDTEWLKKLLPKLTPEQYWDVVNASGPWRAVAIMALRDIVK